MYCCHVLSAVRYDFIRISAINNKISGIVSHDISWLVMVSYSVCYHTRYVLICFISCYHAMLPISYSLLSCSTSHGRSNRAKERRSRLPGTRYVICMRVAVLSLCHTGTHQLTYKRRSSISNATNAAVSYRCSDGDVCPDRIVSGSD